MRVTESAFEARLFQEMRRAGLPLPARQHDVYDESGRFVARVDFAYVEARLAIEAVGYRWHSGRDAWARDQSRCNALAAAGWRMVNVTWQDLRVGDFIETIRAARERG